ncbi:MAG: DHH family phosphoesterase [Mycoplasma sp.]
MIKNNFEAVVKEIYKKLIASKKVTVIFHDNPDNDAYSSALAMSLFLRSLNVDARIMDADMVSSDFVKKFVNDSIPFADEEFVNGSTGIIVDVGNSNMITSEKYLTCSEVFRIDHHVFNEKICELEWIDTQYSSASEMVGYFILFNNEKMMSKEIANALYPGIMADSGNLSFDCTKASTYLLIAKFFDYNFDKHLIQQKMTFKKWEDVSNDRNLSQHVQVLEDGIAFLDITEEIKNSYNIPDDDGKIYLLNNILDFNVWFSIYWKESKNKYKISIRSHKYDVREIAIKFGGGGHTLASAFYISKKEEIENIIKYIREMIKNG